MVLNTLFLGSELSFMMYKKSIEVSLSMYVSTRPCRLFSPHHSILTSATSVFYYIMPTRIFGHGGGGLAGPLWDDSGLFCHDPPHMHLDIF